MEKHKGEETMKGKSRRGMWGMMLLVLAMLVMVGVQTGHAADKGAAAKTEATDAGPIDGYRIGPGDVLSIAVWKNADLTRVVPVLPDGKISFPLIGELAVSDMTVGQLTKLLKEKLEPYSPDPQLSVEVQQTHSLVVYVIGKVNRPGNFTYNGNIDVLQALAMAGGLNPFAKRTEIKILRTDKDGKKEFPFNYDAVTEEGSLAQNIPLKRGDVVVVP
jgi:polysaccharide export outer membrane protein